MKRIYQYHTRIMIFNHWPQITLSMSDCKPNINSMIDKHIADNNSQSKTKASVLPIKLNNAHETIHNIIPCYIPMIFAFAAVVLYTANRLLLLFLFYVGQRWSANICLIPLSFHFPVSYKRLQGRLRLIYSDNSSIQKRLPVSSSILH